VAQFDANIYLNTVVNQASLNKAAASIQKVTQAAKLIKPLNLFAPGSGAGADKIRTSLTEIDKVVKNINQGSKGPGKLSTTFAGASQQASVLLDVLSNVNLKTKESQTRIQNYAKAFAAANEQAEVQKRLLNDIVRTAKGITVGELEATKGRKSIETRKAREGYLEARNVLGDKNLVNLNRIRALTASITQQEQLKNKALTIGKNLRRGNLTEAKALTAELDKQIEAEERVERVMQRARRRRREARVQAIKDRRARTKEAITNATIGGAFPLLFGQGVGASAGGALGGGLGGLLGGQAGFAGSLVGTALGQSFDNLVASAVKLGKALDPLAPDINTITEALGIAGTDTKAYIEALKATGRETEAAAFAIRKLEELVGSEGVAAFDEFGRESQQLTNEIQKFFTQLQASIAQLINQLGFVESATGGISRAVDINSALGARGQNKDLDAAIDEYLKERGSAASTFAGYGIGALIPQEATEAEKKVLEEYNKLLLETGEILDANAIKAREKTKELESQIIIAEQRIIQERGNNDILNASVEAALRAVAAEETRLALIAAQGDARKIELALLDAAAKKLALDNALANARARAAKVGRGGSAPKSKELSLRRDLVKEELKRADIALKYIKIVEGEEAALQLSNQYLQERQQKQTQMLELERQQALANNKVAGDAILINQLYDSRLQTLTEQIGLQQAQNTERIKAIQLERDLLRVSLERDNASLSRGINRDIENAEARLANPFGGEELQRLELQLKQTRRYEDAIRSTSEALEDLNRKLRDRPKDKDLLLQQKALNERLNTYKTLLPVLDELEQKELKQQQIMQKYGFIVSEVSRALSDSIVGVIKGTETVEQAFARMFENIGKAFIDMATQMLAQKLFLTVLGALGGGGGGFKFAGGSATAGLNAANLMGGFASGGPLGAGSPTLVGERGPELFLPNQAGRIVNNEQFDAAYQAMTSGASRQSTAEARQEEALMMETAMNNVDPIDIRYDSTQINSVSYVTEEQMLKSNKMAVKEAQAKVFASMRNKPATRTQLGMA